MCVEYMLRVSLTTVLESCFEGSAGGLKARSVTFETSGHDERHEG